MKQPINSSRTSGNKLVQHAQQDMSVQTQASHLYCVKMDTTQRRVMPFAQYAQLVLVAANALLLQLHVLQGITQWWDQLTAPYVL